MLKKGQSPSGILEVRQIAVSISGAEWLSSTYKKLPAFILDSATQNTKETKIRFQK
jgi:hypothetical protein